MKNNEIIELDTIQNRIYTVRNSQIILDRDLAKLYDVETRALKQAVKRNVKRFPNDFMFELTETEIDSMVSQSVIPSLKDLGKKWFAFSKMDVGVVEILRKVRELV